MSEENKGVVEINADGTWPMCDADCDRMERAAIAVEALTEQRNALLEQNERMREALECQAARKLDTHQFYEVLMRHGWDLGRNSNTTPEEFVAQLTDAAIKSARGES